MWPRNLIPGIRDYLKTGMRAASAAEQEVQDGEAKEDVLSQPFRRAASQIGVIRRDQALRDGEPEGSRTLVLSGLGW